MEKLCHNNMCERPFLSKLIWKNYATLTCVRDHFFHSSQITSQKTEIEGKWREMEIIYFKSVMISLFWGGGSDVAPNSNNLKVHSFSNMPSFLWKTGTTREAGLGQPQYWKPMHHSTASLHTMQGAELWQVTYIFPPFTSIQYNLTVTVVILLQIRKNTE